MSAAAQARRPGRAAPRERALRALDAMPRLDCAVLGLILVERMSLVEAAEALSLPVATVRRRYESALARVRRAIAPIVARPVAARRPAGAAVALRRAS
jgi:DNA-directed RNA polymerase specialized sigma24 family protein